MLVTNLSAAPGLKRESSQPHVDVVTLRYNYLSRSMHLMLNWSKIQQQILEPFDLKRICILPTHSLTFNWCCEKITTNTHICFSRVHNILPFKLTKQNCRRRWYMKANAYIWHKTFYWFYIERFEEETVQTKSLEMDWTTLKEVWIHQGVIKLLKDYSNYWNNE